MNPYQIDAVDGDDAKSIAECLIEGDIDFVYLAPGRFHCVLTVAQRDELREWGYDLQRMAWRNDH